MSRIEAVIFDYGGVLSTTPFVGLSEFEESMGYPKGSLIPLLFGETSQPPRGERVDGEAVAATYDSLADASPPPDWHLLETGKLALTEFHERLIERSPEHLGKKLDIGLYTRFLRALVVGVHWMMVHRVRDLKAEGYRTSILTNNIREWSEIWRATIPMELFDDVVDSSEVGLRKPDPEIYRLACARLGVAPEAAVFLDDSPRHVAAARAVGLKGIVVRDPLEALAELDEILAG